MNSSDPGIHKFNPYIIHNPWGSANTSPTDFRSENVFRRQLIFKIRGKPVAEEHGVAEQDKYEKTIHNWDILKLLQKHEGALSFFYKIVPGKI